MAQALRKTMPEKHPIVIARSVLAHELKNARDIRAVARFADDTEMERYVSGYIEALRFVAGAFLKKTRA